MQTLKGKIISEYGKFIKSLNLGKQYDYTHILDMINFISVGSTRPEFIENFLMNL